MKITNFYTIKLLKRITLLTGPLQERLSIAAVYSICVTYLVLFYYFFSLEPGPASVVGDRMMRLSLFLGIYLIPLFTFACLSWLIAVSITVFKLFKKRLNHVFRTVLLLFATPVAFFILREIYSALLNGHAHTLHCWLYYNL